MSIFQRLQDVLGIGDYDDYDEAFYPQAYPDDPSRRQGAPVPAGNNVVGMPGLPSGNPEVLLMEPRSFDEIPQAVRALKERKSVVLNLGMMEPDQAQRAADYVAGGAFAVDGHQERLGEQIFLFTPNYVQISSYSAPAPASPVPTTLTQSMPSGHSPWVNGGYRIPQ